MVFALLIAGCGSPMNDTWLIRTERQTITVVRAGEEWDDLDPRTRDKFVSEDNCIGNFITLLSRKSVIIDEISNDHYLYSPQIQTLKKIWLINTSFSEYYNLMYSQYINSLTDAEIDGFVRLLFRRLWYTGPDGMRTGPVEFKDINWDTAFAFDTLTTGESVEIQGELYTLDSVAEASDSLMHAACADSEQLFNYARNALAAGRTEEHIRSVCSGMYSSFVCDSSLVRMYLSTRDDVENSTILAEWDSGQFTAADLDAMFSGGFIFRPGSSCTTEQVIAALRNQGKMAAVESFFALNLPDLHERIADEAESFALERAGDLLFADQVSSMIVITDEMIIEAYEAMDSIPVIPETRTFLSVVFPREALDDMLQLTADGSDPMETGYTGYAPFTTSDTGFVSRPVLPSDLPPNLRTVLFSLPEDNTDWQRPVEISDGSFVMIRLNSVIPPHNADISMMENTIRANLQAHLEEQRTMEWLCELEQKHSLEINSDILNELPTDPDLWSEL